MQVYVDPTATKYLDTFVDTLSTLRGSSVPVCIGYYHYSELPEYTLYNTEQLTRNKALGDLLKVVKTKPPVEVWDYSLANISILHTHGIFNTRHVPLTTSPQMLAKLRSFRTSIEYDFGFNGAMTERREKIINELLDAGLRVNNVRLWGDERDKELAKCKYILNIHADESYKIFESARCAPWLDLGVPVISEHSLINDERAINTSYDSFVQTCIHYAKKRTISEGFVEYNKNFTYVCLGTLILTVVYGILA